LKLSNNFLGNSPKVQSKIIVIVCIHYFLKAMRAKIIVVYQPLFKIPVCQLKRDRAYGASLHSLSQQCTAL